MQMKKKIREQSASMAVYVSIVLLSFLFLLTAIFFSSSSVRRAQLQTIIKIKESYELGNSNIETIYQQQVGKFKDKVAPTATITVSSTAVLTTGSITATIAQEDNRNKLDLAKCKYVYNTNASTIGTDATQYTGGALSSESNTLTLKATTAGTYYLHVLTVDADGNAQETMSSAVQVVSATATSYASANTATNPYSTFTAPADGTYKLQVWGAQGGYRSSATYGGKGGYSEGTITLTKGTKLYVYVGGAGGSGTTNAGAVVAGGYNGGGYRYGYKGGGGATDIRLTSGAWNNSASLLSRVIVAGGGGSDGATAKKGMHGGGTQGGTSAENYTANKNYCGQGGKETYSGYSTSYTVTSQATTGLTSNTTANYCGGFGFGGGGVSLSSGYGGAGGGGWYGGSGTVPDSSGDDDRGGGGGSGFVWTSSTASNVPSGYSVATKYYLSSASTKAGDVSFTGPSGSSETGHSGNGYAKITPVTVTGSSSTTTSKPSSSNETETYVSSGLILHYDGINNTGSGHSNTATTWKDLSGNGNDATITGGTWESNSVKFTTSNTTNGIKTNSNFPLNFSQTMNIVFKYSSIDGVDPLFGSRTSTTDGFMIWNYNDYLGLDTKGSSTRVSLGDLLKTNTNYNLTFVFSGTTVKVYKNGVLDTTTNITSASLNLPLTVFTAGAQSNSLGNVYSAKVYNRALTEQEVLQNYRVDKNKYGF